MKVLDWFFKLVVGFGIYHQVGWGLDSALDLAGSIEKLKVQRSHAESFAAFNAQGSFSQQLAHQIFLAAAVDPAGVCTDLIGLSDSELAELIDLLDSHPALSEKLNACIGLIAERVELFHLREIRRHPLAKTPSLNAFSSRPRSTWGPSEVVTLNDQRAGVSLPNEQALPSRSVALTFDDGPHPTLTPQLLEILREEDVQVTFFWIGQAVTARPRIVQEANALGHMIGSHTQTHPDLASRTFQSAVTEIERGIASVQSVLGFADPLFRFPYGSRTRALRDHLRRQGVTDFFWDVDTLDWQIKDAGRLLSYALEQTERRQGGIVLFHDIQRQTIAMMREYIQNLKARGYKPVIYQSSGVEK